MATPKSHSTSSMHQLHTAYAGESNPHASPRIEVHLCVPDEQEKHLPRRRRAPRFLPLTAPLPRRGEAIYLSSTSAWLVEHVIHEWRSPLDLRIEIWLTYAGPARQQRAPDFELTQ